MDKYHPKVCEERRRRIVLSLAAYAYEVHSESRMSDAEFDGLALSIDTSIDTGHPVMDEFFRKEFHPHTGQWIHSHPELDKLEALYRSLKRST